MFREKSKLKIGPGDLKKSLKNIMFRNYQNVVKNLMSNSHDTHQKIHLLTLVEDI